MEVEINDSLDMVFVMQGVHFMIPCKYMSDLIELPENTVPLPKSPDYVKGICDSYGRILAMLDLRMLLDMDNGRDMASEKMLVIMSERHVGLIIDSDDINMEPVDTMKLVTSKGITNKHIKSFYRCEKYKKKVIMELDIEELLSNV